MQYKSTTRLAADLKIDRDYLVDKLIKNGYLVIDHGKWTLTDHGRDVGGKLQNTSDGNPYIVWPDNLSDKLEIDNKKVITGLLNASNIGKQFGISAQRLNLI